MVSEMTLESCMSKPDRPFQGYSAGQMQDSWWTRIGLSVAILAIVLLGGCQASITTRPMTVSVRDSLTHRPVAGALVRVSSIHLHIPMPPYKKFDSTARLASQAVTDEKGLVRLGAYVNHPMQVIVIREGGAPYWLYLERHPFQLGGETQWFQDRLSFADVGGKTHSMLEIQFRP